MEGGLLPAAGVESTGVIPKAMPSNKKAGNSLRSLYIFI
jgi:hypothetical protein